MNEALEASMRAAMGLNMAFAPQQIPQAAAVEQPAAPQPAYRPAPVQQNIPAEDLSASVGDSLGVPKAGRLSLSAEPLSNAEPILTGGIDPLRRSEKPLLEGLARRLTGNRNGTSRPEGKDMRGMTEILRAVDQAIEEDIAAEAPPRQPVEEITDLIGAMPFDLKKFFSERASERFLTAYANGDRALYTEFLLGRAGKDMPARLRERYNDDVPFSVLSDRFFLDFEADLAQARPGGPRAIGRLLSSDAGKLYVLIKGSLEGR
jgi:hypothetical protein